MATVTRTYKLTGVSLRGAAHEVAGFSAGLVGAMKVGGVAADVTFDYGPFDDAVTDVDALDTAMDLQGWQPA